MLGSKFVKFKKNEIGASFSLWELTGDELHRFTAVKILKVRERCVKVPKGALKVR